MCDFPPFAIMCKAFENYWSIVCCYYSTLLLSSFHKMQNNGNKVQVKIIPYRYCCQMCSVGLSQTLGSCTACFDDQHLYLCLSAWHIRLQQVSIVMHITVWDKQRVRNYYSNLHSQEIECRTTAIMGLVYFPLINLAHKKINDYSQGFAKYMCSRANYAHKKISDYSQGFC